MINKSKHMVIVTMILTMLVLANISLVYGAYDKQRTDNGYIQTKADYYAFENNSSVTNIIDKSMGLLSNDESYTKGSKNASAKVVTDIYHTIDRGNGTYELKDSNYNKVGTIKNYNSDGTFEFIAESGYIGQTSFYYTYNDYNSGKTKQEKVVISVLSKVTAKYYIVNKETNFWGSTKITPIAPFEELTVTKLGIPAVKTDNSLTFWQWILRIIEAIVKGDWNLGWNEGWDWPSDGIISNSVEVVAPINNNGDYYSLYEFTNIDIEGYEYYGLCNPNDSDRIRENKTEIQYPFLETNKDVEFYYTKKAVKNPEITLKIVDEANPTLPLSTSIITKTDEQVNYTINPNQCNFDKGTYEYLGKYKLGDTVYIGDKNEAIIGEWPDKDLEVTIYVKHRYSYTVKYYFNGVYNPDFDNKVSTVEGTVINKDIENYKIDEMEQSNWRISEVKNQPLTISSNESNNIIEVFYVMNTDILNGLYINGEIKKDFGLVPYCNYPFAIELAGPGEVTVELSANYDFYISGCKCDNYETKIGVTEDGKKTVTVVLPNDFYKTIKMEYGFCIKPPKSNIAEDFTLYTTVKRGTSLISNKEMTIKILPMPKVE